MGSFQRQRVYDPFDLEILEQAYDAAWAAIVSREPFRDTSHDNERKIFLRKWMFVIVCKGMDDPATLADKLLASMPEFRPLQRRGPPSLGG